MPRKKNTPAVHFKFFRLTGPTSRTHIQMALCRGTSVLGSWHIHRTDAGRMYRELDALLHLHVEPKA